MAYPDISPPKPKLTPRQHTAAAALIAAATVAEAASSAGVSERTLYRWLKLPEFRALVAQQESQIIDSAVHQLVSLQGEAIETMRDMFRQSDNEWIKMHAARFMLNSLLKLRVQQTFESRLEELEQIAYED
jgi:phage terminase small subunit